MLKKKTPAGELWPKNRPQKKQALKGALTKIATAKWDIVNEKIVTSKEQKYKMTISIIKSNNKIHKLIIYNKAINHSVYRQQLQKAIKEEL